MRGCAPAASRGARRQRNRIARRFMHGHPATHSAHRRTLTGLILAGGRGSRLGGIDKGLLDVRGTPLVQQVAARLAGQVDALLLSANRSLDRYRALGFDPLTDGPYVDAGPLAGIRAGLAACATDWLLAVPCDMPFVPLDLRARLLGAAPQDDCRARVPFDGEHHHYACVLLPGTALKTFGNGKSAVTLGFVGLTTRATGTLVSAQLGTTVDAERLEHPEESGSLVLADAPAALRHEQREHGEDAALAAVVGAQDEDEVLDRDDQRQRPEAAEDREAFHHRDRRDRPEGVEAEAGRCPDLVEMAEGVGEGEGEVGELPEPIADPVAGDEQRVGQLVGDHRDHVCVDVEQDGVEGHALGTAAQRIVGCFRTEVPEHGRELRGVQGAQSAPAGFADTGGSGGPAHDVEARGAKLPEDVREHADAVAVRAAYDAARKGADLRLANLLVDGATVNVIDFDDCGEAPLVYDLAVTLSELPVRDARPEVSTRQVSEAMRDFAKTHPEVTFLNGNSIKQRLMSRYLYEHLFLGHLYFESDPARRAFRLPRARKNLQSADARKTAFARLSAQI